MFADAHLPSHRESTDSSGGPKPIAAVIVQVLARYGLERVAAAREPFPRVQTSPMHWRRERAPAVA